MESVDPWTGSVSKFILLEFAAFGRWPPSERLQVFSVHNCAFCSSLKIYYGPKKTIVVVSINVTSHEKRTVTKLEFTYALTLVCHAGEEGGGLGSCLLTC